MKLGTVSLALFLGLSGAAAAQTCSPPPVCDATKGQVLQWNGAAFSCAVVTAQVPSGTLCGATTVFQLPGGENASPEWVHIPCNGMMVGYAGEGGCPAGYTKVRVYETFFTCIKN